MTLFSNICTKYVSVLVLQMINIHIKKCKKKVFCYLHPDIKKEKNHLLVTVHSVCFALCSRLEAMAYLDGSHIKDKSLRYAAWYQAGIPR